MTYDIRKAVKVDYQGWCSARTRGLEEAALESDSRHLHALLRRLKPYESRRDFRISNATGQPTTTMLEERTAVRDAFRTKLGGIDVSMADLIQQDRDKAPYVALEHSDIQRDINSIPSMTFLISKYAKGKQNGLG